MHRLEILFLYWAVSALPGFAQSSSPFAFRKIQLNSEFYSEGINFGDINKDGVQDIVSGPYWYPGPDFKTKIAFRQPKATPFDTTGDSDCYLIFIFDFNGDGWPDILSFRQPGGAQAVLYLNPGGSNLGPSNPVMWSEHIVFQPVDDESPTFTDMDGDGRPELVTVSNGYAGWASPDWNNPTATWTFHPVTAKGPWTTFTHGLGFGDMNGDGRMDLLLPEGWWSQPANGATALWTQHAAKFWAQEDPSESYGGAQMVAYDVDGDGRKDIVTSLQAHAWGLSWFQNTDTGFVEHRLLDTRKETAQYGAAFAQLHALAMGDLDGDGLQDIVTGKRKGAHGVGLGGELDSPAVLYGFHLTRSGGSAKFQPYLIDANAGIGTQIIVADVNGDGNPDILTSARHGTYVFMNQLPPTAIRLSNWRSNWRSNIPVNPGRNGLGENRILKISAADLLGRWHYAWNLGGGGTLPGFHFAIQKESDRPASKP